MDHCHCSRLACFEGERWSGAGIIARKRDSLLIALEQSPGWLSRVLMAEAAASSPRSSRECGQRGFRPPNPKDESMCQVGAEASPAPYGDTPPTKKLRKKNSNEADADVSPGKAVPKHEVAEGLEDMEDAGSALSCVVRARSDGPRSRASAAGKVEPQEGTRCGICRETMPPGTWTNAGSRLHPCFRHRECHAAAKRLDHHYSVRPQVSFQP